MCDGDVGDWAELFAKARGGDDGDGDGDDRRRHHQHEERAARAGAEASAPAAAAAAVERSSRDNGKRKRRESRCRREEDPSSAAAGGGGVFDGDDEIEKEWNDYVGLRRRLSSRVQPWPMRWLKLRGAFSTIEEDDDPSSCTSTASSSSSSSSRRRCDGWIWQEEEEQEGGERVVDGDDGASEAAAATGLVKSPSSSSPPLPQPRCGNCGRPPSHHLAEVVVVGVDDDEDDFDEEDDWRLARIFCSARNLRCASVRRVLDRGDDGDDCDNRSSCSDDDDVRRSNNNAAAYEKVFAKLEREWERAYDGGRRRFRLTTTTTTGDGDSLLLSSSPLLEEKCDVVGRRIRALLRCLRERDGDGKDGGEDEDDDSTAIRLVMACDDVYYQLYYGQICRRRAPKCRQRRRGHHQQQRRRRQQQLLLLPHPPSYFGLVASGFDRSSEEVAQRALDRILFFHSSDVRERDDRDKNSHKEENLDELSERFGLSIDYDDSSRDEHALSAVHRYRLLETIVLLQRWKTVSTSSSSARSVSSSHSALAHRRDRQHDDADAVHETPAPALLAEWRDSCRDFLCHLYSYATVSQSTIRKLSRILASYQQRDGIIELGAGTGYVAACLRQAGVEVQAYDLHPTPLNGTADPMDAANEYHGSTRAFYPVRQGNHQVLRTKKDWGETALLLCYPPPHSDFAYDALKQFSKRSGRVVVFIGEFKGLTGTASFERLLQRKYRLVERFPCLCWVTDASSVSVWIRSDAKDECNIDQGISLLLPCSFCRQKESHKRLRWLRFLTYCSKDCCHRDELARKTALRIAMVDDGTIKRSGRFDSKDVYLQL